MILSDDNSYSIQLYSSTLLFLIRNRSFILYLHSMPMYIIYNEIITRSGQTLEYHFTIEMAYVMFDENYH